MSTSTGSPSKKISWYRSMIDKINHENKLKERDDKSRKGDTSFRKKKPEASQPTATTTDTSSK